MTTENSRADALTDRLTEFDVLLDGYLEALQDGPHKEQVDARNELRLAYRTALLAASPVAQPAAAQLHPDDLAVDRFAVEMKAKLATARAKGRGGWEECPPVDLSRMLRDHVEKGDPRDVAIFGIFLWHLNAPISKVVEAADACTHNWSASYRERMEWMRYCSKCGLKEFDSEHPAPSPADERAAFAYAVPVELEHMEKGYRNSMVVCRRNEGAYSVPIYREGVAQARAASASETGAEGAAYRAGIEAVAKFIDKKAADYLNEYGYVEHDTGAVSWGSGNHADAKRDYHSSLAELAEEVRALGETAPQSAQADARVGLTDEQREAIDFVIGWYEQSTIADNPYREHIAALRALLQGANHAE